MESSDEFIGVEGESSRDGESSTQSNGDSFDYDGEDQSNDVDDQSSDNV